MKVDETSFFKRQSECRHDFLDCIESLILGLHEKSYTHHPFQFLTSHHQAPTIPPQTLSSIPRNIHKEQPTQPTQSALSLFRLHNRSLHALHTRPNNLPHLLPILEDQKRRHRANTQFLCCGRHLVDIELVEFDVGILL